MSLKFVKLTTQAFTPTKKTPLSIGLDLFSPYDFEVEPRGKCLIRTDLQILLPEGCYGRIAPTSNLACNHSIDIGAGVIDPDFTGNLKVLVYNFSKIPYYIKRGDKIAQLILEQALIPEPVEVVRIAPIGEGHQECNIVSLE